MRKITLAKVHLNIFVYHIFVWKGHAGISSLLFSISSLSLRRSMSNLCYIFKHACKFSIARGTADMYSLEQNIESEKIETCARCLTESQLIYDRVDIKELISKCQYDLCKLTRHVTLIVWWKCVPSKSHVRELAGKSHKVVILTIVY